jgi:uncharacterized protein YjbI with pentapeptide repeats
MTTTQSPGPPVPNVALNKKWAGRRITQQLLDAIIVVHARYLDRKPNGALATLGSAKMSGLDFSRRRLPEADFTSAEITGANATHANFERSVFYCADLRGSDLRFADLKHTDLRGACLSGANLSFSKLDGADLRTAVMLKLDNEGRYKRAFPAIPGCVDGGVDFSNCSMKGASLNNVNLKGANFKNALMQRVTFKGAKLTEVNLEGAVLTEVNRDELPFSPAELKGCIFDPSPEAIARAPELREKLRLHELWVSSSGKEGVAGVLDGADLRVVAKEFRGRKLTALCARQTISVGVDFSGCELQGARFESADLREANFDGADLRGAVFPGAKLAHARFERANVTSLSLTAGTSRNLDLTNAEYIEEQFVGAVTDQTVKI